MWLTPYSKYLKTQTAWNVSDPWWITTCGWLWENWHAWKHVWIFTLRYPTSRLSLLSDWHLEVQCTFCIVDCIDYRECGVAHQKTDLTVGLFDDPNITISHRRLELEQLQDARAQELGRFRLLTAGVSPSNWVTVEVLTSKIYNWKVGTTYNHNNNSNNKNHCYYCYYWCVYL